MLVSFIGIYFIIEYLRPELNFIESVGYIGTLFIPVLSEKSFSTLDIEWENKETLFFMLATF